MLRQNKQNNWWLAASLRHRRDGSVLWVGGQGVASAEAGVDRDTMGSVWGQAGAGSRPNPEGMQGAGWDSSFGTGAPGLSRCSLAPRDTVTVMDCPCCVPSTSHRDRSSMNPQVWPCHHRMPTSTNPPVLMDPIWLAGSSSFPSFMAS